MITTPNAELERLTYEIMRWTGDAYAAAKTKAQGVITALLAGTKTRPILHHPLTHWVAEHFEVHWDQATSALSGVTAGINMLDLLLTVGNSGGSRHGYVRGNYGAVSPDQLNNGDFIEALFVNNSNGRLRFQCLGEQAPDAFTSMEIVGVGTVLAANATYDFDGIETEYRWNNTGFALNDGDTLAVEFT